MQEVGQRTTWDDVKELALTEFTILANLTAIRVSTQSLHGNIISSRSGPYTWLVLLLYTACVQCRASRNPLAVADISRHIARNYSYLAESFNHLVYC